MSSHDLNLIKSHLETIEQLKQALETEREALDALTTSRAAYDSARNAETELLREQVKAMQRKERRDKAPHIIAFAETFRDREYDSAYKVGVRLEWRFF